MIYSRVGAGVGVEAGPKKQAPAPAKKGGSGNPGLFFGNTRYCIFIPLRYQ